MAELQFPSIVGGFLQGRQLGQKEADRRMEQANTARLSQLAQQAYGANPADRGALIGEAVGIDPGRGLELSKALGSEDEAREQRLLSTARLIDAAPLEQKAAIYQNARPQIAPYLPGLPDAYNDQVGEGIRAFITSRGGGGRDVKVVGNALVDAAGNVVYQAPQRYLTGQGLIEVTPDGAREIRLGQDFGSGAFVSGDVPAGAVPGILEGEGITGQVGQNFGARITPPGSASDQERLALARESNERSRREEAIRQRFGTIPTGFRVNAEGTALEPVPGGPKPAGAAATEGERKAATLLNRLEFSLGQLNQAVQESPEAARPGVAASVAGSLPFIGEQAQNALNSSERQRVEAAQLDILDAALTLGTGAAYTREQLEGYRKSYFPQLNDSQATVADKAARLRNVVDAARIAAGRAAPQAESGEIPRPNTQAEFDALPRGAIYIDPDDGRQYRKK